MWLRSTLLVFWLCAFFGSALVSAQQSATLHEYTLDIPAQSLEDALNAFSRQTHLRIEMYSDLVRGLVSNGLSGKFTPDNALRALLKNTGLRYKFLDADSVAIVSDRATGWISSSNAPGSTKLASATGVNTSAPASSVDAPGTENPSVQDQTPESKSDNGDLEQIVVTGTHIRGVTNIGSPTLTITRAQIEESGYATMEQVVATLPQNFNGFTMAGQIATGGSNFSEQNINNAVAIDLRGLGPQSTLTLIDGQRVAGNVNGRVVDISLIPLGMVDRIDVVTGGASAIYGADAVGGVANIVLRHEYDGADTQVYYGGSRDGNDRLEFDQLFGRNFDHGGFVVGYEFGRNSAFDLGRTDLFIPASERAGLAIVHQNIVPDVWQNSLYLTGHFAPSDGVDLYGDAMYTHKKQESSDAEALLAFDFYGTGYTRQETSTYSGTAGAKIQLFGSWKMDVSGSASVLENYNLQSGTNSFFGAPPSLTSYTIGTRTAIRSINAVADGTVATVGGIDIKGAVGGEGRQESYSNTYYNDPSGVDVPFAQRKIYAAFAELNIPLVEHGEIAGLRSLSLSAAARDDHYSDFGNAFDPQGSIVWQPFDGFNVRTAYAKAFRAPDLYSLTDEVGADLLSPTHITTPSHPAGESFPTFALLGGNPNLSPERATTWSSGLDFTPPSNPATRLSLSYFHINYTNRIEDPFPNTQIINSSLYPSSLVNFSPTPAQMLQAIALSSGDFRQSGVNWNGNPQTILNQIPNLVLLDTRFQNVALETLRGLDLSADTAVESRIGTIKLGINATDTLSHRFQITPETPSGSVINQVGLPVGLRFRTTTGVIDGPLSGFIYVNYVNHYENQFTKPFSTIASWTTLDATAQFDSSKIIQDGPFHRVTITASVQNAFARSPPRFDQNSLGILYDLANANPFGRYVSLRIQKKW